jgi:FkbM family methyltransferase
MKIWQKIYRKISGYDLVNLHGLQFLVPIKDNLYDGFISSSNKNQNYKSNSNIQLTRLPVDIYENILRVINQNCTELEVIDLGSWVGDFGIRLARQAKDIGLDIKVHCVDPTNPAKKIPKNAFLNGVSHSVHLINRPISLTGGVVKFRTNLGHTDSAHIEDNSSFADIKYKIQEFESVTLKDLRESLSNESFKIFKFDLEGIDADFLHDSSEFESEIVIFEFAPSRREWNSWHKDESFLKWLDTHYLFDIGYAPNPDRFMKVESNFLEFSESINKRPYGYTDLLAIPKILPWLQDTLDFECVVPDRFSYNLD